MSNLSGIKAELETLAFSLRQAASSARVHTLLMQARRAAPTPAKPAPIPAASNRRPHLPAVMGGAMTADAVGRAVGQPHYGKASARGLVAVSNLIGR